MRAWFDAGHLDEELQIRRGAAGAFLPLREFLVGGQVTASGQNVFALDAVTIIDHAMHSCEALPVNLQIDCRFY